MKRLTLADIRRATGARMLTLPPEGDAPAIETISTDSRSVPPRSLFVAIAGEKFDGHDFVAAAGAPGRAIAALVERPIDGDVPPQLILMKVDSARVALGKLARHVRDGLSGKVVAVAGSNGKTGTKHLIHSVLCAELQGTMSPKSFNNDIGVPTAIFAANPGDDFLVLEIGTNHPGEIRTLTNIGRPDIAVITNCGPEHLEFLGDEDGVRRENACIIESMDARSTLIVNGDDEKLLSAVTRFAGRRVTFGFNRSNDLFATDVETSDRGVSFLLNGSAQQKYTLPQLGRHNACNALAAIAVGRRMGLDEKTIRAALAHATSPEMRLQLESIGGVRVLNDAYNANPASVSAAIETFASISCAGRRVIVLGDMLELGETGESHHREIGRLAAGTKPDLLVLVGDRNETTAAGAKDAGLQHSAIRSFANSAEAARDVATWLVDGDLVLLKASRGIRLEEITKALVGLRAA